MEDKARCGRCGAVLVGGAGPCPECHSKDPSRRDANVRLGLLALALGIVLYARHRHWIDFSALAHAFLQRMH